MLYTHDKLQRKPMIIKQTTNEYSEFKIFIADIKNTYLCITAQVSDPNADPIHTAEVIYDRVTEILSNAGAQIIHERIFGNNAIYKNLLETRNKSIRKRFPEDPGLVTYIEGESCYGNPLAGIQLRSFCPAKGEETVKIIREGNIPQGRKWNRNGAKFLQFQKLHGGNLSNEQNHRKQAEMMFRKAETFLKTEDASYRDVVRTWIYVENILDLYHEFNLARNTCYTDFGLLKSGNLDHAEKIFLPASTGITGKNPEGASTIMDLLAVTQSSDTGIQIRPLYGTRQRSPYRYGSAFSRAMCVVEPEGKWIFVSGTASINEKGESINIGDISSQVKYTVEVVDSLIQSEGASFSDLCEATVFLKRKKDFSLYQETAESLGLSSIPAVYLVADVCRDELLFELDAAFVTHL
jgi:enamine deaminase RidA (YjgF/YER057c/UK114 family)